MSVTQTQLADAFRDMGIACGDSVLVHSSFRSLQPFDGGPLDVLAVLRSVIGDNGNIMLPTFNYTSPPPEPCYDPATTPARTGAIVELGRQIPEAVRSLHPTHSVAVVGPDAQRLTGDHLKARAFGVGSPIDLLADMDGKILLMGVGHTSNSTIHVAEEHAQLPKAMRATTPATVKVRMPNGDIIDHALDPSPSCSAGFEAAALPLRRKGFVRDGRAGSCLMQVMPGRDVIEAIVDLLRDEPTVMLCTNPNCGVCPQVRKNVSI